MLDEALGKPRTLLDATSMGMAALMRGITMPPH